MRKMKVLFRNGIVFALLGVFLVSLNSCKSLPVEESKVYVEPLSLLQADSSIYVKVHVKENEDLVKEIIMSQIPYISEKDVKMLMNQLDVLYAGLGTVRDRSRLEISASGNFPRAAHNFVFTKNNGWEGSILSLDPADVNERLPADYLVYSRNDSPYKVSLCSSSNVALAKNINPLIENYSKMQDVSERDYAAWLLDEKNTESLLFYITMPGQYLRNLIGADVTLGTKSVYGSLIPAKDGTYELKFNLSLSNPRAMTGLLSLLKLSFLITGGEVRQVNSDTIEISELFISKTQIVDLFTRDPITGKHFDVDGEKIIQK